MPKRNGTVGNSAQGFFAEVPTQTHFLCAASSKFAAISRFWKDSDASYEIGGSNMAQNMAKAERLLEIYLQLMEGQVLSKKDLAKRFDVAERSIQRDMEVLRNFFEKKGLGQTVIYDRNRGGYRVQDPSRQQLSKSEMLVICKILLDSRSMRNDEMFPILDKMVSCGVSAESQASVQRVLENEKYYYIEPHHHKPLLKDLQTIYTAIQRRNILEIEYERIKDHQIVKRRVRPMMILFSEYYFYLTTLLGNGEAEREQDWEKNCFPMIYRVDRVRSIEVLNETFQPPCKSPDEEKAFRDRVQFMYGGKLEHIRFKYVGPSLETVLDRLPTAEIVEQDESGWVIEAEVFGKGIQMWLRSLGGHVTMNW